MVGRIPGDACWEACNFPPPLPPTPSWALESHPGIAMSLVASFRGLLKFKSVTGPFPGGLKFRNINNLITFNIY